MIARMPSYAGVNIERKDFEYRNVDLGNVKGCFMEVIGKFLETKKKVERLESLVPRKSKSTELIRQSSLKHLRSFSGSFKL